MQRRWANVSLLIALLVFALALAFRHLPLSGYLKTMALAALAGGIADWYAITAVFRHPLGIKWLPHTAIISANRERIIAAIASLVEQELLSVRYLEDILSRVELVPMLLAWLRSPPSPHSQGLLRELLAPLRDSLDAARVGEGLKRFLEPALEEFNAADALVGGIRWLIQSGRDRALFEFLARQLHEVLDTVEFTEEMEARLKELIERYTKTATQKFVLGLLESLGTVDYRELSRTVRESLKQWLASPQALEQFELLLVRVMMTLRDDGRVRERVRAAQTAFVGAIPWESLGQRALAALEAQGPLDALTDAWGELTGVWAAAVEADPNRRQSIEMLLKHTLIDALRRYHPVIGQLVRDNLERMNEQEWIDKLEWYVGRDLQWIRINGAVVGGLVGLLLAVLVRLAFGF
ncbi:MAG: DUF445 domain-containing protein [Firmicutes bacterium]|nr:DUF445 domain-containing protein [Bacillota bacterium]